MATMCCMNVGCGATEPGGAGEWRKGWELRSGGFAVLCIKCGMVYEQLIFCNMFHQKESGWRECLSCGKRLHCGCIASKSSFVLLDSGGIQCIGCMNNSETSFMSHEGFYNFLPQHHQPLFSLSARSSKDEKGKSTSREDLDQRKSEIASFGKVNSDLVAPEIREVGIWSTAMSQQDKNKDIMTNKRLCESLAQECFGMSQGSNNKGNKMESGSSAERQLVTLSPLCVAAERRGPNKANSAFLQMHGTHCLLPKPPELGNGVPSDAPKDVLPHMHVARLPADERGRNQLLPRYWPRITDQEVQQIAGDSNSTIVPLFEKVLSASDAGRIGRLVLPKACAEAYLPPISQPEGLPLTIQDAKGKEWHFQFRFWPNNNSRMYVLEGVTPCIQSLQLQAGDTVTFSRIDPKGKLVMGFRKATNTVSLQDSSAISNGAISNEKFFSSVNENIPTVSGYPGLLQSSRGAADLNSNPQSEHLSSAHGNISWPKINKHGGRTNEGLYMQPLQKKSRNISAKWRRMVMDSEDSLELKLTWEEAQDLLRPPPSAKPSIVIIEDHEIEEYEEPPIFGKKTIFTARVCGEQDQWVQCDDCSKWRRLPVDVLLPSKWTCADNMWDPKRSSCSMPDELSQKEMQILLLKYEGSKQTSSELTSSSLDALVSAAAPGEVGNQTTSPFATTMKHPQHHPGCTCIVSIQPPSGKGPKHDPACTCSVCMTVKRRFKTLMLRKQKRQSECEEADASKKLACGNKDDVGVSSCGKDGQPPDSHQDNELGPVCSSAVVEMLEMSKGQIDLNCHPESYEDPQAGHPPLSMMNLLRVANKPLETYLEQNGLTSLAFGHGNQGNPSLLTVPQDSGESEGSLASVAQEQEGGADEHDCADVVKMNAA